MQSSRDYIRLLEACSQEGCPLCRLVYETTQRYLDAWKYELFTDVNMREELRRSQGFCHRHTWQLVKMGANIQLAQAYRDILSDLAEQLENDTARGDTHSPGLFRRWRTRGGTREKQEHFPCPACREEEQGLERLISELRQALTDGTFYAQFSSSSGLCLEHFHTASGESEQPRLSIDTAGEWLPLLRQAQLGCLQRLDDQLTELIRKHDYQFKDEARGPEMLSWKRAAGIVAGENEIPPS